MALIDLKKAFDKVWTDGLIYKLIQCNTPPPLIHIIRSYLTGRTFVVKVGRHKSGAVNVTAGVPQGSVLEPMLFPNNKLAMYADDTALYARSFS